MDIAIEQGSKRVFAGAIEWPGWCRRGKTEDNATETLLAYAPRYARTIESSGLRFAAPLTAAGIDVTERVVGDRTTDFGAPGTPLRADRLSLSERELTRLSAILQSTWSAFDGALQRASDTTLTMGPRGGGRQPREIALHVLDADVAYLRKLGSGQQLEEEADIGDLSPLLRGAILEAVEKNRDADPDRRGPRGGKMWTVRYFVRRSAWHALDHAWEIEDRLPIA